MAKTVNGHNRDLIEQVRKVNKLLSLYVLALQEEMAVAADDHEKLAGAVRALASTIEHEAEAAPRGTAASHPVIHGEIGQAPRLGNTATEA